VSVIATRDVAALTDDEVIQYAQDIRIEECLRGRSFRYTALQPLPTMRVPALTMVLNDPNFARTYGYGGTNPARALAARSANPNQRYLDSLAKQRQSAFRAALYGTSDDLSVTLSDGTTISRSRSGCQADALRALYGDLDQWFTTSKLAEAVSTRIRQSIITDSQFTATQAKWARCMADHGHPAASPFAIRRALAAETIAQADAPPLPAEVQLATAEAVCATGTRYAQVIVDLRADFEDALTKGDKDLLALKRGMESAALVRAHDIVAARR
jgi:hypothetical protein